MDITNVRGKVARKKTNVYDIQLQHLCCINLFFQKHLRNVNTL